MSSYRDQPVTPTIQSPCVRNCCLDESDTCLGCGRQLEEILHWHEASDAERRTILLLAQTRRERR